MLKNVNPVSTNSWHIDQWPPLAWLETVIKLVALVVGIITLIGVIRAGDFDLPGGARLAQTILMGVLALGLIAALFDRLIEREIVAMAFVIVNNLGHWGMVIALASGQDLGAAVTVFCGLMLVGDIVKLVFLRVHKFSVRDVPRPVLVGLTLFYVVGYTVIVLL
ncbi:MAG: hypothetical protein HY866_10480 [Chloroflexi bacterium]|nr:hypothetical protein [Chloroflexota bacterium]